MRPLVSIFIVAVIVGLPITITAKECGRDEAIQAETEASTLSDWDSVYKSFQRFSHCDDGAISEGYSEAVSRLLAQDWKHFGRLVQLAKMNKSFEHFVVRHIDETVPSEYLRQIVENAHQQCPSNGRRLCRLVETAAKPE